jgi:hypothetical protein
MSLTIRMYRARLGVGQSKEIKKTPGFIFSPGVGINQDCCAIIGTNVNFPALPTLPTNIGLPVTPINVSFTSPNNFSQNTYFGIPITYTLPPLPPGFLWRVFMTIVGGNGFVSTATQNYPAGTNLYIYVGTPGTSITVLGNTSYLPGGGSGVFESLSFLTPGNQLHTSPGGTFNNSPRVTFVLNII